MPHKARYCVVCGQAFRGLPWERTCEGCRATKGDRVSDFNLPDNCTGEQVDRAFGHMPDTCMTCRHCLEECCDYGVCERRLYAREPKDFDSWAAVLDYLDSYRVDMQQDTCAHWEEWK